MTPIVQVKLGDLFEGSSDLIVLPCSTSGSVTSFVSRRLVNYSLPYPSRKKLGSVEIIPFIGGENIAQFVAFATSVHQRSSSPDVIEEIGVQLGRFTKQEPSVRIISTPLLGAGAGGLESRDVISSLRKGFMRSAHAGSTLIIHVLHESLFDSLRTRGATAPMASRPRVFISHTPTNDDDKEWVKELAVYLKERGIQARLDLLHLHRGMDLPQWMTNEISLADKVIIVCNEKYKQRSEGRLGGVGWKTMIIQGDLSRLQPDSTKYQVVVRTEKIEDGLPMYLQTRYAFHARPSDGINQFKDELVSELLDISRDEYESTKFVL